MGKIKGNSLKKKRFLPFSNRKNKSKETNGTQDNSANKEGSSTNKHEKRDGINIARKKIMCDNIEEKITGLNMVASFALELEAARVVLKENLVSSIAACLKHSNLKVKLGAAGALRNICTWDHADLVTGALSQGLLAPLAHLIRWMGEEQQQQMQPKEASQEEDVAFCWSKEMQSHAAVFVQAAYLLSSLCEWSEEALTAVNREDLTGSLLRHMDFRIWGDEAASAAAECLLNLTEANERAASSVVLFAPAVADIIHEAVQASADAGSSMRHSRLRIAVVLTGVLLNVGFWCSSDDSAKKVLEVVAVALREDCRDATQSSLLSAQMVALEILCNLCCPEDEEEDFVAMEIDSALPKGETSQDNSAIPALVAEGVRELRLLERTQELMLLPPLAEVEQAEKGEDEENQRIKRFSELRVRAAQCFQNAVSAASEDQVSEESLYAVWESVGCRALLSTPPVASKKRHAIQAADASISASDVAEREAWCGSLRAVAQRLMAGRLLAETQDELLQAMIRTSYDCSCESVRVNLCRALCCVAVCRLNCGQGDSAPLVKCLLKVAETDSQLHVRAEALDALVDAFSDDATDAAAAAAGLVAELERIAPRFREKLNREKRDLGEHAPLLQTVRDNLQPFIKYKARRVAEFRSNKTQQRKQKSASPMAMDTDGCS